MGLFGRSRESVPPHPRREPRIDLPLSLESLERVFRDAVDFSKREVQLAGDPERVVEVERRAEDVFEEAALASF